MTNFAIIGVSGYIAKRHMQAINETNNNLVLAYDPNDTIGSIDEYFPNCLFYTDYENFFYNCFEHQKFRDKLSYISICSPNYMHFVHCANSLRLRCNVICEKPLVSNPAEIDILKDIEKETGYKIFNILQLRHHSEILKLKKEIVNNKSKNKFNIKLTYITSRGNWYLNSWKGQKNKSFGLLSNIGIHFFDMLHFIFGELENSFIFVRDNKKASGHLEFSKAKVSWFLSIDGNDLPSNLNKNQTTFREITINDKAIDFTNGFSNLHTTSYFKILNNEGFNLDQVKPSIETVYKLNNSDLSEIDDKLLHNNVII